MTVKRYVPDTDFGNVYIASLTLEIRPWVNVMTQEFIGQGQ